MGVNADGYWTVNGEVLKDSKGTPITATTDATAILRIYPKLTMDISISHWVTEKPLHWKYSIH